MLRTLLAVLTLSIGVVPALAAGELAVLRQRFLEGRPETIRRVTRPGQVLPLRLFDDAEFNARLVSIEDSAENGFVWRGTLDDTAGGWAVLVEDGGCMVGTIMTGEAYFRILCLGWGRHVIEEVAPVEPYLDDVEALEADSDDPLAALLGGSSSLEEGEIAELDIMVVYTRKAAKDFFRRYELEGHFNNKNQAMKAYIRLAVAIANTAFINSEVDIHLRLVKTRPIGYKGKVDSSRDLANLRYPDDGFMDQVHAWRDRYGADFVSLVVTEFEEGIGGRAYLAPPGPTAAERLFSVLEYDNLWQFTLAHEVGHNMGLAHDHDNDSTSSTAKAFRYSHGYRDPTGGFITIMSYFDGCPTCRWVIPHFSNRTVRWQGAPTGIETYQPSCGDGVTSGPRCGRRTGNGRSDCARSLDNTREFYAGVRPCAVDCGN